MPLTPGPGNSDWQRDADRRLRALELASSKGWVAVDSGSVTAAASTGDITVPAGFSAVRLTVTGINSAVASLLMSVNGVTSSDSYRTTRRVFNATYTQTPGERSTAIIAGSWGTTLGQQFQITFGRTDVDNNAVYRGEVMRRAGNTTAADHVFTSFDGRCANQTELMNKMALFVLSGTLTARWTLEGYRS